MANVSQTKLTDAKVESFLGTHGKKRDSEKKNEHQTGKNKQKKDQHQSFQNKYYKNPKFPPVILLFQQD